MESGFPIQADVRRRAAQAGGCHLGFPEVEEYKSLSKKRIARNIPHISEAIADGCGGGPP